MPSRNQLAGAIAVRRLMTASSLKRRTRKKPPEQRFPRGPRLLYLQQMLRWQKALEDAVRQVIYPQLSSLVTETAIERPDSRFDQAADYIETLVAGVRVRLGEMVTLGAKEAAVSDVATRISDYQAGQFNKQVRSVTGVNLAVNEPWLGAHLAIFRKENISLIESLQGQELDAIEQILMRASRKGMQVREIQQQIQKRFSVSRSKAALLARDQTNKLNGELNQLRQQALGVDRYIWRTSQDERVRPMHAELDGTEQRWDRPPVTNPQGDRNHPGEDYQCRCQAEPVLAGLIQQATGT